jgi:hypothetical protein
MLQETGDPVPADSQYLLISIESLKSLLESLLCSECSSKCVVLQTRKQHGFSTNLIVKCESRGSVLCQTLSSPRSKPSGKVHNTSIDVIKKIRE